MGIRAGGEMTSLEQRWVAIRTKDFCGPVDTLAVGYGCLMINGKGEKIMEERYAHLGGEKAPRFLRLNAPMTEWLEGRAPTYVDTRRLTQEESKDLREDLLNERPSFVLFLASKGIDITKEPVEIFGSDPYIVGGHTGSGYWVALNRMTTIPGLFAAGETAGGSPNKFVGGCATEGRLAARGALEYLAGVSLPALPADQIDREKERVFAPLLRGADFDGVAAVEMEEKLQRLMDEYAGGVSQFYRMNEERLLYALKQVNMLQDQTRYLFASDLHDLLNVHEVIDRLSVAEVLLHHLLYRKETRWEGWQTRMDYPEVNPDLDCFIESRRDPLSGEVKVFTRSYEQLVAGDRTKG